MENRAEAANPDFLEDLELGGVGVVAEENASTHRSAVKKFTDQGRKRRAYLDRNKGEWRP
jgi:hypothetical protein